MTDQEVVNTSLEIDRLRRHEMTLRSQIIQTRIQTNDLVQMLEMEARRRAGLADNALLAD